MLGNGNFKYRLAGSLDSMANPNQILKKNEKMTGKKIDEREDSSGEQNPNLHVKLSESDANQNQATLDSLSRKQKRLEWKQAQSIAKKSLDNLFKEQSSEISNSVRIFSPEGFAIYQKMLTP